MGNVIDSLVRHKFAVLLCVVACIAYQHFFVNRAHVDVTINVEKRTLFKIYWAEEGQYFSEKNMAQVVVKPERKNYSFFLTDIRKIKQLRIDPQEYAGSSSIEKIRIRQNGSKEILFASADAFGELKPLAQIARHSIENDILKLTSSGKDGNFSYEVSLERQLYDWRSIVLGYFVICGVVVLVYSSVFQLGFSFRYIPALLIAVLALAMTMAMISERNVHPDEYVHLAASKYYTDHWLPPVIGDEKVADTYSVYGVSRLNTNEISYLLCGKFAQLLGPLQLTEHIPYRLFNIFLLTLILLYTMRVADARPVALPLLISPQIWYLYSYCNSDAFAITAAFFVGCQVVVAESSFNQFVSGRGGMKKLWYLLVAAFLFGILFLLKANFLVYTAFLFWVLLLRVWQTTDSEYRKLLLQRWAIVCCVGLSLMAGKKIADYQVNGLDRSEKIDAVRAKMAKPLYNPNTPLEKQHNQLYMKKRGIPLEEIIQKDRWFEKSFRSMFGVYGYSTISGGFGYYDLVRWTGIAFSIFFFFSILIRSGTVNRLQVLAALSLAAALIAVSLYHSWTKDFQAQGRYFIPLLPILGVLCGQCRQYVHSGLLTFFTTCMYFLSVYSFICIALLEIPRLLRM